MATSKVDGTSNGSVKSKDEEGTTPSIFEIDDSDLTRLLEKPRPLNTERKRSFDERSFSEMSITMSPRNNFYRTSEHSSRAFDNLDGVYSPGRWTGTPRSACFEPHPIVGEAWEALRRSIVNFRGQPVGTIAALDNSSEELNYDQVFVRDFVPSALAFLMNGEPEIVKNFLLKTVFLQSREKKVDNFKLGEGVMPASFKVLHNPVRNTETILADYGESAIGRVAPVDSGFWWIILLRAYTKSTGDTSLAERPEMQRGIRLIMTLCLSEGFDTFPTLLCADGCCMIDRRMGVYGYPIEIQALFFMALRCALSLLKRDSEGNDCIDRIVKRLHALSFHMRSYFWLDIKQLNDIYRYKTEEYSHTAVNKFNVIPDSLPDWVFDFMPTRGGYFIGNVSPAKMDFRWFCLGNCVAILSSLATPEQSSAIMDLIESRWQELVGEMPLKICYPAMESHEWRIVTGCDPKNTSWSYHNGGSWPVLLWLLTAACIKAGRPQIAKRATELAESRLLMDGWPEYYDGKMGRYIGKQARKNQTWSIAGYLVAKMMLEDPSHLGMIALEEDKQMKPHPDGRLLQLVEQALDLQREACLFHNSDAGETSLYANHHCGRDQIPSQTVQILQEHQDEVWYLQFSHNGKYLASSSSDNSAVIWEVNLDGKVSLKHRLTGHQKPVSSISWSPDDSQILTCGVEEVVRRWDVSSGECLHVYEKGLLGLISCSWSPDGKCVFSGLTDKSIVIWDLDGKEIECLKGQKTVKISDLQITSDGKLIITICKETMILLIDRESKSERCIEEEQMIVSFTLSRDNKYLLVSLVNEELHLWNIEGRIRPVAKFKGHKRSRFIVRACFGGLEQAFIASGSEDSQVYIWHRGSGELIETLRGHSGAVNCISWNPVNPHMLASASDDRSIRIWGLKQLSSKQNDKGKSTANNGIHYCNGATI